MIRIGVICPSEIALRRFLPSLQKAEGFQYVGVAVASPVEWFGDNVESVDHNHVDSVIAAERGKAQCFVEKFGGSVYEGYETLVSSDDIDAIYLPLPPSLHFKWAEKALLFGKHVFLEKPSTTSYIDTNKLISLAKEKSLALHENYMFVFHNQLESINEIVRSGEIGDVRLYRISFGFPRRDYNDFRYNKALGGGALLDAGGYTVKYASVLLSNTGRLVAATTNYLPEFDVDIYGSATMINDEGMVAQLAFGMDNDYKCEIEIWGSKGTLTSNRVMTAPPDLVPSCTIKNNQNYQVRNLPKDDAFLKSLYRFKGCVNDDVIRQENYSVIEHQAKLVERFRELSLLN